MKLLASVVAMSALGCHAGRMEDRAPKRIGWIMVTRPCDESDGSGRAGVARVAPGATAVVIEPVFERAAACPHVLRVVGGQSHVRAGEVAELEVSFDGAVRETHVLEVQPPESGAVLLTSSIVTVPPGSTARIRVTAATSGNCDIVIRVRECSRFK